MRYASARVAALVLALAVSPAPLVVLGAGSAQAQAAPVVLEGITLTVGPVAYRMGRMELRGTNLSKDELSRLFDPAAPEPVAARIDRLQAAEIAIPEIMAEATATGGKQTTTYREVAVTKVAGGRIGSVSSAGGTVETTDARGTVRGSFGRFALDDLDLSLSAALFAPDPTVTAATPLKRVYGGFSLENLTFDDPNGGSIRLGRMSGRDFSARPTAAGWNGTAALMTAKSGDADATPAERAARIGALAELFDAFEIGSMEITDVSFAGGKREGTGRIGRIAYQGSPAAGTPQFEVSGIEAGSPDGRVRLSSFSLGDVHLKPMLDGLRNVVSRSPDELSAADIRRLLPIVGNVRVGGIDFDGKQGAGASPVRVGIGGIDAVATKPVDGVPSDIRVTIRNLAFPVPADGGDNDGTRQLAGLGYDRFDGSLTANLGWNEAGQEIVLRELSVDGAGMGSAVVRAVIGNVGRDIFNPDSAVAAVALLGASARSAEITVENRGLFERAIARTAERQKRRPEDVRREYGIAAAVGIPAMLGNSPAAKTLGQAVARFVAQPTRLTIRARAKQPGGYGAADFAAGPDPASVLDALEITASAE